MLWVYVFKKYHCKGYIYYKKISLLVCFKKYGICKTYEKIYLRIMFVFRCELCYGYVFKKYHCKGYIYYKKISLFVCFKKYGICRGFYHQIYIFCCVLRNMEFVEVFIRRFRFCVVY